MHRYTQVSASRIGGGYLFSIFYYIGVSCFVFFGLSDIFGLLRAYIFIYSNIDFYLSVSIVSVNGLIIIFMIQDTSRIYVRLPIPSTSYPFNSPTCGLFARARWTIISQAHYNALTIPPSVTISGLQPSYTRR